ncbi:MAG: hypothetical protein J7M20_03055 [Deltaproteobacteria bacterium]|nr:hypothetical protein [Deltaproteobacteria bacterium]
MNFTKIHSGTKTLLTALAFLAFQCCSPLMVKPPAPALDEESVTSLVSAFSAQEEKAKTLFFSGTLTLKEQDVENSVQILMIADATSRTGTDDRAGTGACPYGRMKIEITHPWGKTLIHILIEGQRLDILDFTEKRFYRGRLKSNRLSERIPVPLNPCLLWSLARAFPALLKHHEAASFAGNQITLLDPEGEKVQVFELYSSEPLPYRVSFCKENAVMVFSDFEDDDGILYARKVNFHGPDPKVGLAIEIDQMRFNTPLPEAVFRMEVPRDFKTVHLKDDDPEH